MAKKLKELFVCLLAGIFVVTSVAIGAEPSASPGQSFGPMPGILLLKNGQVIEGRIEFSVDHYTVHMPDEEMQIRASNIEFFCRDLEDGYQHKKSVVQPNNVEERLHLAQWCEQHGMLSHASEELDAAEKIDDKNPMIKILRNRLQVLVAVKKELPIHPKPMAKLPGDEELDQMIRGMPPGAVQQYVNVVQPILLNLCPGAGGSTPGLSPTGRLQLLRPPYGESPNRRITQRNLFAVLQFVNWDEPGASPLLAGIIGGEASVTVRHSEQYRRIKEWVYAITQKPMLNGSESLAGGEPEIPSIPEMAQQIPRSKRAKTHNAPRTVRSIADPDVDQDGDDAEPGVATPKGASPTGKTPGHAVAKPASGAAAQTSPGADPFDPAEFNRQSPAAGNASQPNTLSTPAAKMLGNRQ